MNLCNLQSEVLSLINLVTDNNYDVSYEYSYNEYLNIYKSYIKEDKEDFEKVGLCGFVLFDFDSKNNPYILEDLNIKSRKNMIDSSLKQGEIVSGFKDYSNLIRDLLIHGVPEVMINGITAYGDRIMGDVFYNVDKRETTGMIRIRPLRNSPVRFVCKELVLYPKTESHSQVTNLLKEILPNVQIDLNEKFSLFVNFGSALKRGDTDSYSVVIKRFQVQSALYKLLFSKSPIERFSDDELNVIRDIILMTLDAYKELENYHENLDFSIINSLGGAKNRGL